MIITGPFSQNQTLINKANLAQTKGQGDLADKLAQETDKAQQSKDDKKLRQACKDMEAMFLNLMMTNMRNTVQKSGLVDTSKEEIMRSMLDSEMTKNMAEAGGIGIADMLYRQLSLAAQTEKKSQAPK